MSGRGRTQLRHTVARLADLLALGEAEEAIPRQLIGRLAAILFIACGLLAIVGLLLPLPAEANPLVIALAGATAVSGGVVLWSLPWNRWPRSASLWLVVPAAFFLITVRNLADPDPYRYAVFFIITFLWIGVAHPTGTSLRVLPLFLIAYLGPLLGQPSASAFGSVLYIGGICVLTAEVLAWVAGGLRRVQERLYARRSEARFQALVQNASDIVTLVGEDHELLYQSPSIERVLGYAADFSKQGLLGLLSNDDLPLLKAFLAQAARHPGTGAPLEWRVRHRDGSLRTLETVATNLLANTSVGGLVLNSRDITERKALEEQLTKQALHDTLTGLANRALFHDRLVRCIQRMGRTQARIAVLLLDVDYFKTINDSLGHSAGDRLLALIGKRLLSELGPDDTAARFGGDEFAILLEHCHGIDDARALADRLLASLRPMFVIEERSLLVRASIGITVNQEGKTNPEDLLREAELAMYAAKAQGRNRYAEVNATMGQQAQERLEMEAELRLAIERGELRVFYQPIVHLATERVLEIEALVRWAHPRRGLLGPDEFIPLAEETGLIVPLGLWVLEQACRQVRAWQLRYHDLRHLTAGVNLSARQFQEPRLLADIRRVLSETCFDPHYLKLEVTESVAMQDPAVSTTILSELKQLGVRVALDDFGTGYSSLAYLKRFPVDTLKVDRSFVQGLGADPQDTAIVESVLALAKKLGLSVTAEGIEQRNQHTHLQNLGCERGQGYLFSRPLPANEFEALFLIGAAPEQRAA